MGKGNTDHFAELRLSTEADSGELLRAFVREASLVEKVPAAIASLIASDAEQIWRVLCQSDAAPEHATVLLSSPKGEVRAKILLNGHSRFSAILPSLGAHLLRGAGLSYRERGVDGWEVTLHRALEPSRESTGVERAVAEEAAPTESVQIDAPQQSDSAAIARCFLAVYGHNYVHREVFSPHRYWRKVENGELIPMVSRDARGEVIGHVALERDPGAMIAERGEAVVLPSYRGRHLLERMTERLTDEAVKLGLVGIYAEPVTTHTFSQRNDERAGMPTCAILLGAAPETLHSKDLPVPTAGQRQSFLLTFKFLKSARTYEIVAPNEYRDVISSTYDSLGVSVSTSGGRTPTETRSMTSIAVNAGGYGRIRFERTGSNAAVELAQAMSDVEALGARTVQLSAHLEDPGLPLLVDSARRLGFFFCGLAPAFSEGRDLLLMQRLSEPLDISELQLFTEQTKKIAAFIERDRQSASSQL
ncbi:hypothetical protein [Methylocystis sp. B8]|uniref:hypothetical protein n=1 Tax=Methylocystis sp. B8 TaxID=544938 RepID=UPI0010FEBCA9|nr:hypothetical protein [Methylocystis sp. B8]TLG77956.1 hypothetical protein FEV16_05145 [Methylocystis sp. B8]